MRLHHPKMTYGWLLLIAVLCIGCSEKVEVASAPRPIRAMRIGDTPALTSRTFPGTAQAVDAVEMSFRVGGPLIAFPAKQLGKQVSKGEVLAQIDTRDFELRLRDSQAALAKAKSELDAMRKARPEEIVKLKAEVDRAEAAAKFARVDYERNIPLEKSGAVSSSDLELSEAKSKLADAELVQAKESLRIGEEGARPEEIKAKESQIASLAASMQAAQDELNDTKLVAPFDGTVASIYAENFEVVQPKQRIVRLINSSELEIRIDVPENLIALVPKVTEAFVSIHNHPDLEIPARIAEVGTEATATTRTYPVKLRFSAPPGVEIRPGMTGTVRGRGDAEPASKLESFVIPTMAVLERDKKQVVWIYDPAAKTVRSRRVTVLGTTPYGLSVSGIQVGEWVVTAGAHYLEENQAVRLDAKTSEKASS